jgi:phenylalanyl-tRNA synthetase beta chain
VRFSLEWLRRYVDVDEPPRRLAERLTMAGLPVDQVEAPASIPPTVVVAKILEARPHPNADRLSVCRVDAGQGELTIVCGAPNARTGLYSPLATIGTTLPNGMTVKEAKIRGEKSQGMLCAQDELGLGTDHDGIIELAPATPGTPVVEILGKGDTFFEVDVPSNRGDCLSHIGLAREIAALTGRPLRLPTFTVSENGTPIASAFKVTVDSLEECPRFTAHLIRDVKIGPSPAWLVKALESVGQRSINNVVDVSNFVLLETGQPSHAFDLDRIGTGRIHVRLAKAGERLTTLDDVPRELSPEILLITDGERPIAAAGVMGGAETEVHDETKHILLEVACFKPERILRGSRRLRLETDAALRFRRGVDPVGLAWAARRAVALLAEVAGGKVAPGMIDVVADSILNARSVSLRPPRVSVLLGEELSPPDIASRLKAFGFEVPAKANGAWEVGVPSWRRDVLEEVDLIEEVARHRGYDAIGERLYNGSGVSAPIEPEERSRDDARQILRGFGFEEVVTRNLTEAVQAIRAGLDERVVNASFVRLLEPPTRAEEGMRVTLIPELLSVVARNLRHGQTDVHLFELGKTFHERSSVLNDVGLFKNPDAATELPVELSWIALASTGGDVPPSLERVTRPGGFAGFKGAIEGVLQSRHVDAPNWRFYNGLRLVPEGALEVLSGSVSLGFAWEVSPAVREAWDIPRPVFVAQLRLDLLPQENGKPAQYREPSRFPAVRRDLALVAPEATHNAELKAWMTAQAGASLVSIELFDEYRGKHIPEGRVGLGYSLTFRAMDRTLEEKDVDAAIGRIVSALAVRGITRREG